MKNIRSIWPLPVILLLLYLSSCRKDSVDIPSVVNSPNILFIVADDLGKDALSGFSEGTLKPNTPNIDAIRNNGLSFSNFWVNPTCTPTRAAIITGKYGYRTNMKGVGDVLADTEITLQKYISDQTNNKYASAIIGKWHLSGNDATANPETFGIDHYAGLIRGAVDDYYSWQLTEDGASSLQTNYITEKFTDLSIEWIKEQAKPWFLWLAYNAPHTPFHVPPSEMHNQGTLAPYLDGMDPLPYYLAAIEAMDYQIGKLLANVPDEEKNNTVIIFIGDNGTPNQVAQSPYSSSMVKNTLYQGGVNTPLFIAGPGITRSGIDDNLVTGTDLFATIAEIAGVSVNSIHDSKSIKSLFSSSSKIRDFQYTELFDGTVEGWTISDGEFKLIVKANGEEKMYNLTTDPYEGDNLLDGSLSATELNAKIKLMDELAIIRN